MANTSNELKFPNVISLAMWFLTRISSGQEDMLINFRIELAKKQI